MTGPQKLSIGIVLFDDFEALDVFGPVEMFGMLADRVRVVTIGENGGRVRCTQGPSVDADFSFDDCPDLDVLLIPGGIGTRREVANARMLAWLTDRCARTAQVLTVCTGSGLLARSGALDGKRATSNKLSFAWVRSQSEAVDWIETARWVVDGKFVSSAGVSAGMDMSLAVIADMFGRDIADLVAQATEYEWHDRDDWDPFSAQAGLGDGASRSGSGGVAGTGDHGAINDPDCAGGPADGRRATDPGTEKRP